MYEGDGLLLAFALVQYCQSVLVVEDKGQFDFSSATAAVGH